MDNGIKSKFIKGVVWGIIEKFASLATGFIITLVLARILTPADYGLVNMIYIFTVLGSVLLDGGFGQALIQRKNITTTDISSVFYINLVMSGLLYIILYLCAPLIAKFYHQPSLIEISRVVFLTIPINAFCVIQHTLLTKELKVKELTYVSIISAIVSGALGITLACMNYGVWALVVQSISYQLTRSITLWSFSKWRPVFQFSTSFIKNIFGFSMNLLGVFTLAAVFQNIYTLLIGRLYNVIEVGYYNQAFRMQSIASTAISSSVERVAFPAFSQFQDDLEALRNAFRKVTLIMMSIYFPVMMCLIVVSNNLFEVLLTAKWLPSVPLFCLLCVAESFYPLNKINSTVLKALGKGKQYFHLNLFNYGIITISIIFSYKYGIQSLLLGYAIAALIRSFANMIVCGKAIKYPLLEQLKDLTPIFIGTLLICGCTSVGNIIPIAAFPQLLISFVFGLSAFIVVNVLGKSMVYFELKKILNR